MYIDLNSLWIWFGGAAGAVALIWTFYKNIKDIKAELKKPKDELNERLDRIEKKLEVMDEVRKEQDMTNDMIYQILSHLATSNNTGNMRRCLDAYNKFFREKE